MPDIVYMTPDVSNVFVLVMNVKPFLKYPTKNMGVYSFHAYVIGNIVISYLITLQNHKRFISVDCVHFCYCNQ